MIDGILRKKKENRAVISRTNKYATVFSIDGHKFVNSEANFFINSLIRWKVFFR